MTIIETIKGELENLADKEKSRILARFFKTATGEYGEGDIFIGVSVPNQRKVAKSRYKDTSLSDISELIRSPIHEHRLTALFLLINLYQAAKQPEFRKEIIDFYLRNLDFVNNWDLVDSSAYKLLGDYLIDKEREILYDLAKSHNVWHQRVAIIATMCFIKNGDFKDCLAISEMLLTHKHDLIHKAVGWMLREIGNRHLQTERAFLDKHHKTMPRTMLRYAIEKFEPKLRAEYLVRCKGDR
jgi:3-methyladenine DNA glycosylase AlkD